MSDMAADFNFDFDSGASAKEISADLAFPSDREIKMRPVGKTKWRVGATPNGISYADYQDVLNTVYHLYTKNRALPDLQSISLHSMVGAATVKKAVETKEFVQAITARGVPWLDSKGLTSQQMLAIQVLTNPTDKRALKDKLRAVGVTYPVYRGWMNQPAFSQYMFKITEGMLTDHLPDFNTALTNKGLAGDLNAIRYINELSGRHDPNRQQVLDLVAIVEKLLDIIQRNVTDPVVFQKIAAEFQMTVASKTTLQGEITRGPNN